MRTAALIFTALVATLSGGTHAADRLVVSGAASAHFMIAPYAERIRDASDVELVVNPVGTGQAMLDLLEGRSRVAVITVPVYDAVAAARVAAWSSEHRLLAVGKDLEYHRVRSLDGSGRPLAFVTIGAPAPGLARVIDYLSATHTAAVDR